MFLKKAYKSRPVLVHDVHCIIAFFNTSKTTGATSGTVTTNTSVIPESEIPFVFFNDLQCNVYKTRLLKYYNSLKTFE